MYIKDELLIFENAAFFKLSIKIHVYEKNTINKAILRKVVITRLCRGRVLYFAASDVSIVFI